MSSPICARIVPEVSLARSSRILPFRRMWRTESCSGRSTRATRILRYTTRASDHSNRPCRFCSCGIRSSATGSSSWTTTTGSTVGRIAMESPQSGLSPRSYVACRGARGATDAKPASPTSPTSTRSTGAATSPLGRSRRSVRTKTSKTTQEENTITQATATPPRSEQDRLAATTSSAQDLYAQMLKLNPNRVNPGWALWSSAHAAKP